MSFAPYETVTDRLRFEELLVRLSSTFVHLPSDKVETAFETALQQLGQFLGLDRVTLYRLSRDADQFVVTYSWSAPGVGRVPRVSVSQVDPLRPAGRLLPSGRTTAGSQARRRDVPPAGSPFEPRHPHDGRGPHPGQPRLRDAHGGAGLTLIVGACLR